MQSHFACLADVENRALTKNRCACWISKTSARMHGFGLSHEVSAVFGLILRRDAGIRVQASKNWLPSSTVNDPVKVDLLKEWR